LNPEVAQAPLCVYAMLAAKRAGNRNINAAAQRWSDGLMESRPLCSDLLRRGGKRVEAIP
jgi:hypothetical protein